MKSMKKLFALIVALCMVLGTMTTVFAADANLTNHTYKAYQIFKGTQAAGSDKLAEVDWAAGVNGSDLLTALKAETAFNGAFANCTSAADVAAAMEGWADKSANAMLFAKYAYANKAGEGTTVANGQTGLAAGYYLVVDNTNVSNVENGVKNLALLQLTNKGTFTIENKTDVPELVKKVKENSNATWQDAADYNVGDDVPFQLTATLPTDYANYEHYYMEFNDTLSDGLKLNASSIKVTVAGNVLPKNVENAKYYIYGTQNKFQVVIYDLKEAYPNAKANETVVVEYTAKLTGEAVVYGKPGNPNTAKLVYSNNPNNTANPTPSNPGTPGTPDKPQNPENPDTPDKPSNPGTPGTPTDNGKTPEDKVVVFTYQLDVNKTDKDGNALSGAGFTLYRGTGNDKVAVGTEITGVTTFQFKGIDAGTYTLVETTVPNGYNKAADVVFKVVATYTESDDNPVLTSLDVNDINNNSITVGENAAFSITTDAKAIETTVINKAGATLPETGGMGTTIFYALGSILVIVAGVMLITRRRMSVER